MRTTPLIRPLAAAALALALAGAGATRVAAQQPAGTKPAAAPKDPRTLILDRLRRLDAKPDTARRDSAAADSIVTLAAPGNGRTQRSAAPASIQQDSIMKALEQLSGFTSTLYTAKSARFAADTGRLVLLADSAHKAQVVQADQSMSADSSLVYNQNTQIACGYGKPVLSGAGQSDPVESDQVCYDTQKRMGVAFGARTKFQNGATAWYVDANHTYLTGAGGEQRAYSADAEFTDCDLKEPHYHFTAKEVKIIKNDVLVARNVTLSFADVPVFWLPFMMQSMQQGRRSGLLMPRFDLNDIARTNANYQRRVQNLGFYWAINDHLGALTSMDWFSGNYTALQGAFDYSFRRQFFDGGLSLNRYWRTNGSKELTLGARNSWRPDERTNISVNASYATSSSFVLQQSFDPRELNRSIDSNVGIQRRFDFGSLDFSARRRQMLSTDRVTMTLPQVSLSLVPISLLHRADGSPLMTWNGSGSFGADQDNQGNPLLSALPSTRNRTASFNSSLSFGKLSLSQGVNYQNQQQLDRGAFTLKNAAGQDSATVAALPGGGKAQMTWNTSLSFQQRLIGTSSISPSLSLSGQSASLDSADYHSGMIAAPTRLNFGASTQMDIYGFWPGVGPFAKIRHKLSPSFSYTYSPAPTITGDTASLRRVFGMGVNSPIRETNTLNIGLNQTFEAKYKESAKPDSAQGEVAQDTTPNLEGEPRKPPEVRKLLLLAINTSAVAYDFTNWPGTNRRIGFQAPTLSNTIRSDLIPGLQFNLTHDLFQDLDPKNPASQGGPRKFSPFLTSATTSFSLSNNSWIFRFLGLGEKTAKPDSARTQPADSSQLRPTAADQANNGMGLNLVPGANRGQVNTARGSVGSWNANFNYSLSRQRPDNLGLANPGSCGLLIGSCSSFGSGPLNTQMLTGNFSFQPTPSWSVQWQTGYNITQGQFADHILTLTRDLHDWEAHFDFVKAQNGNFSFQFRVNLKAQPDLKFDYSQRSNTGPGYNNYFQQY